MVDAQTCERQSETKRVVLLVDDDVLVRSLVADHLRDAGFAVIEAAAASEAISVIRSGTPVDIVFTDVQMPGAMDGLALARWARQSVSVAVLLTSGVALASAGQMPFLAKPYTPAVAERRIRELLGD